MQFGFQVSRVRNAVKIDSERAGLRGYTSGERSEAAIEKIQTFNAFIKTYACAQSGQCPFDLFIFRRGAAEQRSFVPDVLPDRKAALEHREDGVTGKRTTTTAPNRGKRCRYGTVTIS